MRVCHRQAPRELSMEGNMSAKGTIHRRRHPVTHCKRGHKFSTDNTYLNKGKRLCRKCRNLWRTQHSVYMRDADRRWRESNPEKVREIRIYNRDSIRKWKRDNPESAIVYRTRRRTSVSKAGGSFSTYQWIILCKLYGNKCLCCRKKKPLEADHVIPVSKSGSSNISNIQPLCRSCNAKKGTKATDYRNHPEGPAMSRGRKHNVRIH